MNYNGCIFRIKFVLLIPYKKYGSIKIRNQRCHIDFEKLYYKMEGQMNEKFFDLAREKQDRMINGAIEVFAKNGAKDSGFIILDLRRASIFLCTTTVSNICYWNFLQL